MIIWNIFSAGGLAMFPLLLLALVALAVIFDKIFTLKKNLKLPQDLLNIQQNPDFSANELEAKIAKISDQNFYRPFFLTFLQYRKKPIWQLENFLENEAKKLEEKFAQNLWLLETIITAAPLLGLLGTIIGMMSSFRIIGEAGVVNPVGVSAGVAESLIATAFGLIIAMLALFAFNFFEKVRNQKLDELERIASLLVLGEKIDQEQDQKEFFKK